MIRGRVVGIGVGAGAGVGVRFYWKSAHARYLNAKIARKYLQSDQSFSIRVVWWW